MDCKLQNIVFPPSEDLEQNYKLFYRGTKGVLHRDEKFLELPNKSWVEFSTYLNGLSMSKWVKYTDVKGMKLILELSGKSEIVLVGYVLNIYSPERHELGRVLVDDLTRTKHEFDFGECTMYDMLAFEINSLENVSIYGGCYIGKYDMEKPRDIVLSIGTTTCKKEKFIKSNIALIKQEIFEDNTIDPDIKDNLYVHVVDNGRTLTSDDIEGNHVILHPNKNTGGSGGFARGMIESLKQTPKATHVLLMDDDVKVLPESIKRTYRLFSLVTDEYKDAMLSGAMLYLEEMRFQHEDIGSITKEGHMQTLKGRLDQSKLEINLINEKNAYASPYTFAAWWYCGIPVTQIERIGLPMPFFIRIDDCEYGRRMNTKIMSMNGIGIWHMGFFNKYNIAIDIYQQCRNTLIGQAIGTFPDDIQVFDYVYKYFRKELLKYNYNGAQMVLEALQDYLKGPEFIEQDLGEKLLKQHSALNEKFQSLSDFPNEQWKLWELGINDARRPLDTFWFRATYNGHRFWPEKWLSDTPAHIMFDYTYTPQKLVKHKVIYAINPDKFELSVRHIDKKRYRELKKEWDKAVKQYRRNNAEVCKKYKEAFPYLTSMEFWEKYLEL